MTNLSKLMEEADEGSRDLDLKMWGNTCGIDNLHSYVLSSDGVSVVWKEYIPGIGVSGGGCEALPHFTTSVDAAMMKLPKGWRHHHMEGPETGPFHAWEWVLEGWEEGLGIVEGKGHKAPLALCSAILLAREVGNE